ncbi:MAG: aspartate/glutamate racemase family protein [Candidatus Aminicenantes bacterium]|nr:MAG: aspartate/glutamate racemase family protein [Candidatus Aminicenantes bacterium]
MKKKKYEKHLKGFATVFVLLLFFVNCGKVTEKQVKSIDKFQIISDIKSNKSSPFYIDFEKYPVERRGLPIGVFDSGTGGLTVLNSILTLDNVNNQTNETGGDGIPDFISERFIYLGDKANMPYGRYDSEGKADFLKELIIKDVQFLLRRKYYRLPTDASPKSDKNPAKAIVIACNTATAFGFDLIREAVKEWGLDIEVIGIIDAGAESAVAVLPGNGAGQIIGVMATEGTCASNGYPQAVRKEFTKRFHHSDITVVQQAGFGLAGAIDGDSNYIDPTAETVRGTQIYQGPGLNHPLYPIDLALWEAYAFETGNNLLIGKNSEGKIVEVELNSVDNYIKYHVTHLVVNISKTYPDQKLGAVILGCTHYPFFEKEIRDHFTYLKHLDKKYDKIIPDRIILVDPAESLAVELYNHLKQNRLLCSNCSNEDSAFYISVPNPLLVENQVDEDGEFPFSYKYGRFINKGLEFVKRVPFSRQWIKEEVLNRIKDKMPEVYKMVFH